MTKTQEQITEVFHRLRTLAPTATPAEAIALRRAALVLRKWYESECTQYEEDEDTPYWYNPNTGRKILKASDKERGAQRTITTICKRLRLYFYLRTEPPGGTLYVSKRPIPVNMYYCVTLLV